MGFTQTPSIGNLKNGEQHAWSFKALVLLITGPMRILKH